MLRLLVVFSTIGLSLAYPSKYWPTSGTNPPFDINVYTSENPFLYRNDLPINDLKPSGYIDWEMFDTSDYPKYWNAHRFAPHPPSDTNPPFDFSGVDTSSKASPSYWNIEGSYPYDVKYYNPICVYVGETLKCW